MGHPRVCEACDETKEVSRSTYTPSKTGLRGWKTICKVCENLQRSERVSEDKSHLIEIASADKSDLINEMYLLHMSNQKPTRVSEIADSIAQEIRDLHEGGDHKESFELFIDLVKPLVAGWMEPGAIHEDIKDGLLSTHRRRLVIATRYSAKSTLCSIYVAWRIFLDPFIKIMVVSRGAKLAARMLRTVRRVFIANCPALVHLSPTEDCLDNAEQFQTPQSMQVVTGGATLTSLGMGSNLPGFRADLTIGDDVEGPQDDTPEKVVALEEALNELHMINPRGEKVLLGTYQSEFSVYAKLADLQTSEGESVWESHRACMFEVDKLDGKEVIHSRWAGMFTDKDGLDWRKSVTTRAWRLHVLLIADPSILNERPLKIGDLPVLDWNAKDRAFPISIGRTSERLHELPRWSAPKGDEWYVGAPSSDSAPLASVVMAVDPASGLAGRDAIGVAVLGITQAGFGIILHLEGVRAADKYSAMRRTAHIAKEFNATNLIVEELADGLFGETLEGHLVDIGYPTTVTKVTTGGQQKGRRIIESLAPPMGAGRMVILESVVVTDHGGEFVNQLVRISYDGRTGKSKDHDDIVDALAHATAHEKHSLISDIADNIAEHRISKVDAYARVPLRYGGLGGSDQDEYAQTTRVDMKGHDRSIGERLVEEDEVLISLTERRDRLMEVLHTDLQLGKGKDPVIAKRIQGLTNTINELKELQVI
jgi:hypothetical protein